MTPTKTWKSIERKVADKLGGKRIPCSGNGAIEGDVLHDIFHVEVKHRARFAVVEMFEKATKDSHKKKPVILCLHAHGSHRYFAMMDLDDFVRLLPVKPVV